MMSEHADRLRKGLDVTEVWDKNYRGWDIVFVERKWKNSPIKRNAEAPLAVPAFVLEHRA